MALTATKLIEEDLTRLVIGGFYSVYNVFGFGFSEKVYCSGLEVELKARGLRVDREVPKQVYYRDKPIAIYKVDMIVERKLIVEVKATKHLVKADHEQLHNYLRVTDLRVGLLLHFGPKPVFHRMVCTNKPFLKHL